MTIFLVINPRKYTIAMTYRAHENTVNAYLYFDLEKQLENIAQE